MKRNKRQQLYCLPLACLGGMPSCIFSLPAVTRPQTGPGTRSSSEVCKDAGTIRLINIDAVSFHSSFPSSFDKNYHGRAFSFTSLTLTNMPFSLADIHTNRTVPVGSIAIEQVPRSEVTSVVIVAIVFLSLSWTTMALRIWTRAIVVHSFGWDDTTMIISMVGWVSCCCYES
jgi:hypothetical protein